MKIHAISIFNLKLTAYKIIYGSLTIFTKIVKEPVLF